MTLQDLIAHFRSQVSDEDQPYLWSDAEVLLFAIDAQDRLVRAFGGISDYSTTALTDVALVADTPTSTHSPYILRIRSGKLTTAKRSIEMISESDVGLKLSDDYGLRSALYLDDTDTGAVMAGILGMEKNKIRWFRVPSESDTCRMHIYRLPYPRISTQQGTLEVDVQHHIHLISGMKELAYQKEDSETFDKAAYERNKSIFADYCEKVRQEEERQRFKPRVVRYGGL